MRLTRIIITLSLAFIGGHLTAQRRVKEDFDVLHYKFEVELNDNVDQISGDATVTIRYEQAPNDTTKLDLATKASDGFGMEVSYVKAHGRNLDFVHEHDQLKILTPDNIEISDTVNYIIAYQGIPRNGLIISINKLGDRTFFAENWPNRAHQWLPVIDHVSDKATCEFIVTAPSKYQVLANGDFVDRILLEGDAAITHWQMNQPIPVKVMVIGVAEFVTKTLSSDVSSKVWLYQGADTIAFDDFSDAPAIFSFVQDMIGAYPYSKLDHAVSTTRFGGMENAGNIFYDESSVVGKGNINGLIAHEIAHQWFGNSVTEADWEDVWISEGFATYVENEYIEMQYGRDSALVNYSQQEARILAYQQAHHQATIVQKQFSSIDEILNPMVYEKAAWALRSLRHKLGDEVFSQVVQTFYERFKHSNASSLNFVDVANSVSGLELGDFFSQCFLVAESPNISVSWKYKKKQLVVTMIQRSKHVFALDVDIQIQKDHMTFEVQRLFLDQREQTFYLKISEPVSVLVDPLNFILGPTR